MQRTSHAQPYWELMMKKIDNDVFFSWVEDEIAAGHTVRFRLRGNSMFPLLRNGKDVVVLKKCPTGALKPMDVVLFRYRGKHVLHRIICRDGDNLLIQGDGSMVAKEQCTVHDVVGKVVQVCRPQGRTVSVESWKWRVPSHLWRYTGLLRKWILRVAYRLTIIR